MADSNRHDIAFDTGIPIKPKLLDPPCLVGIADMDLGVEISSLSLMHPELVVTMRGKAEINYFSTYGVGEWFENTFITQPGASFFIDVGDQVKFTGH